MNLALLMSRLLFWKYVNEPLISLLGFILWTVLIRNNLLYSRYNQTLSSISKSLGYEFEIPEEVLEKEFQKWNYVSGL